MDYEEFAESLNKILYKNYINSEKENNKQFKN